MRVTQTALAVMATLVAVVAAACSSDDTSTAQPVPRQCAKDTVQGVMPYPCENKEVNNTGTKCGIEATVSGTTVSATSLKPWFEATLNGIPGKVRARQANPDVCSGVVWTGWQSQPKDPNNPNDPGNTKNFRIVTVVAPQGGGKERISMEQPARPEDPTVELYTVGMQTFPGDDVRMCVLREGQQVKDLVIPEDCTAPIRIVP